MDLELLAGDIGGIGNADGIGVAARFNQPGGVAVDGAGNVYVADRFNHTIRKVTGTGVVTTLAGAAGINGSADGTGAAARFTQPGGVAVDSAGNVYVADRFNHTIRKITAVGVVTTLAGTANMDGSTDALGAAARFRFPTDVAVDGTGNVYVADSSNHTIRKVTAAGVVTTLAGSGGVPGSTDSTGAAARFDRPGGVAVDGAGNVYVADSSNHTIRKVTAAGVVTTLAGMAGMPGNVDGTGAAARFGYLTDVAVDSVGNVYVADGNIRKVTAAGVVTTLASTAGEGLAVDSAGNVYVTDMNNHTIRKMTPAGDVTTLAGAAGIPGSVDGTGAAARFSSPSGVAADSAGNVYVADSNNHTIRRVTGTGGVTTLAGAAGIHGSADGTGAAARFYSPSGVAVDSAGNVYVADRFSHTIRKITAGGVVTTLAGTAGVSGSADGMGSAARFYYPTGVAVDGVGNVYVADNFSHNIRKVTAAGVVTTLAGAGSGGSRDGTGAAARFMFPTAVGVDSAGNVYVADQSNHTIRKVTAAGVVTTLAGTAQVPGTANGVGAAARFSSPSGVAVDSAGNVYVADTLNSSIRKVTAAGTTTTIAGMSGMGRIDLGATPQFAFPVGLAIIGDSIVNSDANAILLLRHGAQ